MNSQQSACVALMEGILEGCSPDVVETIIGASEERSYLAGSTIFSEGESLTGVYCHCTGEIAIELGHGDARHEVGRSRPGQLLGYREPERHGSYIVTTRALTDATLFFTPLEVFNAALTRSPQMMINIMRLLSERIDGLENRLFVTGQ